jgi:alkylation response protein AidB-like acyl-CoA dehydrogenase
MDFALSDEQQAIYDMALEFGQEHIAPFAQKWEQEGTIPCELLQKAGELGFGGLFASEQYGGANLSRLDGTLIFEALSMSCPSVASFISVHNLSVWMINEFGSEDMKQSRLPDLCNFNKFISYCLTEPGSGSDAAALRTRATKNGDQYLLSGTKSFISGGNYADTYLIMCRTGLDGPKGISSILVDKGSDGLSFGAYERKMGWRSQPTAEVQLADCQVPVANLLGDQGKGFTYAMAGLDGGRLSISASALGGAQSALDKALQYTNERKAFGSKLNEFQALQFKLADMEIELQASRALLHKAAWKLDTKAPDATKFSAMSKRFVTDTAFKVANDALQLHGGYGYLEDYGIEKIVRDLRVHQILEGSNEIMRLITARELLKAID